MSLLGSYRFSYHCIFPRILSFSFVSINNCDSWLSEYNIDRLTFSEFPRTFAPSSTNSLASLVPFVFSSDTPSIEGPERLADVVEDVVLAAMTHNRSLFILKFPFEKVNRSMLYSDNQESQLLIDRNFLTTLQEKLKILGKMQ